MSAKLTELIAAAPDLADLLYAVDVSDTAHGASGSSRKFVVNQLSALAGITPGGRLTLESGVPISTTDQTAKGTLYYTPYVHDYVRLYDGTRPNLYTFTERSLALTLTSGKNYDVFLYDNSGTLTLELSAAWTNDTTRADALAWQSGVGYVKSGTATRLWLGTIRASGTNATESSFNTTLSAPKSYLWNKYNQVTRSVLTHDSTDSWTYTTATWRQVRASAENQINFICGEPMPWNSSYSVVAANSSAGSLFYIAIGFDSTSAFVGATGHNASDAAPSTVCQLRASASGTAGVGLHYISALENSQASGTTSWYGDAGGASYKMGLEARIVT